MPDDLIAIAFVSGKGGVGKTSLASNFADTASDLAKTVLIDLDFQNQGATGLLTLFHHFDGPGAIGTLVQGERLKPSDVACVKGNLHFLPAIPSFNAPSHREIAAIISQPSFAMKLARLLEELHELGFRIVVLDCHGGLDYVSLAAHLLSHYTIVVTEADTVTFNGTLELLDFYESGGSDSELQPDSGRAEPKVKFVVNRVPSRFKWEDLNQVYERTIRHFDQRLSFDPKVLAFIPNEEYVSDNFGEYPFTARLAPKSIFSRKINLMVYDLLSPTFPIPHKCVRLRPFRVAKKRRKVERTVISHQARNIRSIIQTFTLVSCLLMFLMILSVMYVAGAVSDETFIPNLFVRMAVGALCVVVVFSIGRSTFRLMRYYMDLYQFKRSLVKAVGKPITLAQRIELARLFLLRLGTTAGCLIIVSCLTVISAYALLVLLDPRL